VCGVPSAPRGAGWVAPDTIVFATAASQGLLSVPSEGGSPKPLTKIDSSRQEYAHFYPAALPGQRGILYASMRTGGGTSPGDNADLVVLDFGTGTQKMVLHGGTSPEYMPSGHLVYAVGGGLRAVHFDLGRLEAAGDPVPVLEHVSTGTFGSANFAVSQTGTLLYVSGNLQNSLSAPRSLVWVDRHGREEPIAVPPRAYTLPRLSPDGTRVALDIRDQDNDIWIFDLKRSTLERRTFDPSVDQYPVWTTDGRRILFGSIRSGLAKVFAQDADGSRPVEQLSTGGESQFPTSMSPDGKHLIVREAATAGRFDIAMVTLGGNGVAEPLLHSAFSENNGEVSPDGRWLAYQSDESGRDEIYVRPFPNVNDGQWQVSTAGGTRPLWARSGRELFFLDSANLLHAVSVTTSPAFSALSPVKVLSAAYFVAQPIAGRSYDVSPDGKRFLMIKDARPDTSATEFPAMVLVLNWLDELKGRLP
jgi:eukaryotic-like serine/threonine-protein kinase